MIVNHNEYRLFDYINNPSKKDRFILGEVVKKDGQIGVIIQCHGNNEYRTDMFGNCGYDNKYSNLVKADMKSIKRLRPELLK